MRLMITKFYSILQNTEIKHSENFKTKLHVS